MASVGQMSGCWRVRAELIRNEQEEKFSHNKKKFLKNLFKMTFINMLGRIQGSVMEPKCEWVSE